ncbi:glycosyltransferase [Komagataeibacter sp. FXV3]|nr:glycosyltransferase [Komagataeibacter sp. FXV3]MBE7729828.1 glycosyltransferase [Komagataeibacter sp. FXV3]
MRYEYYESHKVRSDMVGNTKAQAQNDLFKRNSDAYLFAVGPLLKKSCEDLSGRECIELVPGFVQFAINNESSNDCLNAITFGRMDSGAAKIKQGRLAVAGFGRAIRRANENPGVPKIWEHNPRLTVVGISEDDMQSAASLKGEADKEALRSTNVSAVPFETDRNKLFDRLKSANIAVMASLHEGFGLTGWEAIAAEVPLILTKNSGLFQLIDQGLKSQGNGYVKVLDIKGGLENDDTHEDDIGKISDAFLEIGSALPSWKEKARNLKRLLLTSNLGGTWEQTAQTFLDVVDPKHRAHRRFSQVAKTISFSQPGRPHPKHRNIRCIEQKAAETALKGQRIVWVTCSPGMGEDGFCSVLMDRMNLVLHHTHIIDFDGCSDKSDFLQKFRSSHGHEFADYIKYISDTQNFFWLFRGVNSRAAVAVAEEISSIVTEFYSAAQIIVLSEVLSPRLEQSDTEVIKLKPLDEIDFKIYLHNTAKHPERFLNLDTIASFRRFTDGIPAYIDAALNELEYTTIQNLLSGEEDSDPIIPDSICFDDIQSTILSLKNSSIPDEKRAYKLLIALMAFPYGVQLDDIKRFYGPHGLHGRHADILRTNSLIDVKQSLFLDSNKDETYVHYIHIPRPIRDVIKKSELIG